MSKPKIIVHCLVKNEERFIWYSLNSVLPFVDKILVWDTGSTDQTLNIVRSISSPRIVIKEVGAVDPLTFTDIRNQMLKATPTQYTWMMILDGDEIWPVSSMETIITYLKTNPKVESLVVRTNNLVGDIYHRLPDSAGHYNLAGKTGHLNLRFINLKLIPGLNVRKPHGQQGYYDGRGKLIQNRDQSKVKFIDVAYHHATHLQRSINLTKDGEVPKRKPKLKYELGEKIDPKQLPEVFFSPHPKLVPDVTKKADLSFLLLAMLQTLPRRFKRILFPPAHGY